MAINCHHLCLLSSWHRNLTTQTHQKNLVQNSNGIFGRVAQFFKEKDGMVGEGANDGGYGEVTLDGGRVEGVSGGARFLA